MCGLCKQNRTHACNTSVWMWLTSPLSWKSILNSVNRHASHSSTAGSLLSTAIQITVLTTSPGATDPISTVTLRSILQPSIPEPTAKRTRPSRHGSLKSKKTSCHLLSKALIYPQVVWVSFFLINTLKNVGNRTADLWNPLWKSKGIFNCSVTHILQNTLVCV